MKIEKVHLENFRCFKSLDVEMPTPVFFLTGLNESGKSTFLDAIEYALTGRCRGLDGRGSGAQRLLRIGSNDAGASILLDTTKGPFTRSIRSDGSHDTPTSAAGKALGVKLGVSQAAALVCLRWDQFIDMPEADAKALLLNSLGIRFDASALKDELGESFEEIEHIRIVGPESLEQAYQHCYAERRKANKAVKEHAVVNLTTYPAEVRVLTAEQAQERLDQARAKLKEISDQVFKKKDEDSKVIRPEYLEKLREAVKQGQALIDEAKADMPSDAQIEEAEKQVNQLSERVNAEQKLRLARDEEIQKLTAQCDAAQIVHETFLDLAAKQKCPTCKRKLPEAQGKKMVADAKKEVGVRQKALQECLEKQGDVADSNQEYLDAQIELNALTAKRDKAMDFLGELEPQQEERVKELDKLQRQAIGKKERVAHHDMTVLQGRLEKGQAAVQILTRYVIDREAFESSGDELERKKVKAARLDDLCQRLGPKGDIAGKLMGSKLDPFEQAINAAIQPFGAGVKIQLDPFDLKLYRLDLGPEEHTISMRLLSYSTRLRLGLAIQTAFALASGLKLICIDQVDCLDINHRRGLPKALKGALDRGIEQIILAATLSGEPEKFKPPKIAGWKFALLDQKGVQSL